MESRTQSGEANAEFISAACAHIDIFESRQQYPFSMRGNQGVADNNALTINAFTIGSSDQPTQQVNNRDELFQAGLNIDAAGLKPACNALNPAAAVPAPIKGLTNQDFILAFLDEANFVHAQIIIEEFNRWQSYDDFMMERDGLFIGLSCAGQNITVAEISIEAFTQWISHVGVKPTIASLDQFAALMHAFRHDAAQPGETSNAPGRQSQARPTLTPQYYFQPATANPGYLEWLNTLSRIDIFSEAPSVDTYTRMLLETWSELP